MSEKKIYTIIAYESERRTSVKPRSDWLMTYWYFEDRNCNDSNFKNLNYLNSKLVLKLIDRCLEYYSLNE
jgi:hypothetical protein